MARKLILLVILLGVSVPCLAQTIDTVWVRRYSGPGNAPDYAYALAVDNSGNVYVTGEIEVSSKDDDWATIKYYPNGDTAWVRRYNGPGNAWDGAYALAVDNSGNVYVAGYSCGIGTNRDYTTIKYLSNGDTAWVRRYSGPGNRYDYAYAIAVDGAGNVYVTGESEDIVTDLDYVTIKYFPNGDTAWIRRYNGPGNSGDGASAIAVDDSGNVCVTGYSLGSGTFTDYATIKYLPDGDTAWIRRYNGPGNEADGAYALAVDDAGNVCVTGYSVGSGTSWDYATIKYLPNGDTAWARRYNGPGNSSDEARATAVDNSGNVYVTGYSGGSGTGDDYATIKYFPNGDTAWIRTYNGPGYSGDGAEAIAVDGAGNVYVTGWSYGDYATIKYLPNGDTAWVRRYNSGGSDVALALVVGGSRNVYVTGQILVGTLDYDWATIKYAPKCRVDTLSFNAYSPVDLIVTDPMGDSIGVGFNTIPNATYDTTTDRNSDGDKDDQVTIPNPLLGQYMVRVIAEPEGSGYFSLTVKLDGNEERPLALNDTVPPPNQVDTFTYLVIEYLRGDANMDGKKTVSDVVFLINYLFKGGPAPNPVYLGDVNCDGKATVSDVIYLINYLFKGGPPPYS